MTLTRRPARADEVAFLASLFLSSMRDAITAARGHWDLAKERAQFLEQLELEGTAVIELAGSAIGFVSVRRGPDTVVVDTLWIAEEHRRKGFGATIMRQLMAEAAATGSNLDVFVLRANSRARELYARLGFVDLEQLPHHFRMRWPDAAVTAAS